MLEKDTEEAARSGQAIAGEMGITIKEIQTKLQRLLDSYLEQDIEREVYLTKKAELMSQKKSLEEKMLRLRKEETGWVEPLKKWIQTAESVDKIAQDQSLTDKKALAKEIFGSNLSLTHKTVVWGEIKNGERSPNQPWGEIKKAHDTAGQNEKSFVLVGSLGFEPRKA